MNILENYLHELNSQYTSKDLPRDLVDALLKDIYPPRDKTIKNINDMDSEHDHELKYLNNISLKFIDVMNLRWIYTYWNGDSAWYSFKDKKVYDYNHELEEFNDYKRKNDIKLNHAIFYKNWIQEVEAELHDDAWASLEM